MQKYLTIIHENDIDPKEINYPPNLERLDFAHGNDSQNAIPKKDNFPVKWSTFQSRH